MNLQLSKIINKRFPSSSRNRVINLKIVLLWCVFLTLQMHIISFAQSDVNFERISTEQGLSQNSIVRIFQDSRGFLWLCTFDGLNRYDGYQFKIFRNISDDSTSLSNNKVLSICEDYQGNIWIGTYGGGLNKFERAKETFKRYLQSNQNSLSSNIVTSIIQDKDTNLWIGTFGGGLNKFNPQKEKFIHYNHRNDDKNSISSNNIIALQEDQYGILWVGTLDGLNRFDKSNQTFTTYKFDSGNPASISNNKISSISEDNLGNIWVGTFEGGLNVFSQHSNDPLKRGYDKKIKFFHFVHNPNDKKSISSNGILSIYQDSWGDTWIGTDGGGLNKTTVDKNPFANYNSRDERAVQFLHFIHNPKNSLSLSEDRVWSILEDKSGILWIGTNAGLNKVDVRKKQFESYSYNPLEPGSISDGDVSSILKDSFGNLWVGTGGGGLNLFDQKNQTFIHFKHNPNNSTSLSNDEVFSLYQDAHNNLWIGTYGGLNKLSSEYLAGIKTDPSPVFNSYKHDPSDTNSLSDNRVYSILEDHYGILWIGTLDGGLNRLIQEVETKNSSPTFQHFKHNPGDPNSISADRVFSIFEDSRNNIWIGTWGGGLNKILIDEALRKERNKYFTAKFVHYKNEPDNPFSLSDNGVLSIYEDHRGTLWIGTYGGGLNKFDNNSETFNHFTKADGLTNNVILGILEDPGGNLWLSTIMGLNKFNPKNNTFNHFNSNDGLPGNEFSLGTFINKNGEMYFGGTNGFIKFHPDSIKDINYVSPVIITDFKIFNRSVPIGMDSSTNRSILSHSILETKQIDLNHDDYVISFEFASIDFHRPDKIKYLYIMEGFDREWNLTDASRRTANYTNLDPGNYTFKVKTEGNSDNLKEAIASIKIFIHPPWWKTFWAYSVYVFLFAGTLLVLYLLQMRRIRLKHEIAMSKFEAKKLQEIDELKSNFFANISHEFRTPLTLIIGPIKDLINTEKDLQKQENLNNIHRNADMLYGLVNQLMDLSKLEAGKMKLNTCEKDIVPIIKSLVQSFESLAERKKITLTFQSDKDEIILFIDVEKIEKIVINILSNAIKFTKEGKQIKVSLELVNEKVEIIISDEGIGIPKDRINNIFDRFYQVDGTHTREHEGTGIGLALTKELIELHKGEILVQSEEGKGTTFTVRLPIGKDHLKPEEICEGIIEKNNDELIHSNQYTIQDDLTVSGNLDISFFKNDDNPIVLIVEDNQDVRNYIKGHLNNSNRIIFATNGEEGYNQALEHIPDLIISDVMMPKMDGFKLCNKLKTDERTSHIPIILLTAKATGDDKIDGLEKGADDYIMKPFDAKELQVRVKNLIDQRKKIAEYHRKNQLFNISEIDAASVDKKFLIKAFEIVNRHIADEDLSVEVFANEIALSRVQLHRKLVALIGYPPGDFIRIVRLSKAAELIKNKFGNISEIGLEVGFSNSANFAKAFRSQFGVSPTEFKKRYED